MAIKKAFQDIVAFCEENENSKVKTILPALIEMCSAKSGGAGGASSFLKDADGNITHIRCYYHNKWEPVNVDGSAGEGVAEYGAKATSATKLNSMCKEGVSNWTKQQREAKKANEGLLASVAAGDIAPTDIVAEQDKINEARKVVVAREDGLGTTEAPAAE